MRRSILLFLTMSFIAPSICSCLGYTSALGFRARKAVLRGDSAIFDDLMEEAADTTPAGPLDNPELTVLTHFLDLADSAQFFPYIDSWMKKGWVGDDMTCAIHRAHFRAMIGKDDEAANRSAQVCIERARKSAPQADRSWEVKVCLEEAPFLVDTSTTSLLPYLAMAADPTEPITFRHGLLDGMTRVYITSASRLRGNDPTLTREQAIAQAQGKIQQQQDRILWIIERVRQHINAPLLAAATSRGVMEVENVAVPLGRSFVGHFALSGDPYDNDLAWAWVRSIKNRKMITRIKGLGLWNRRNETKKDVYWYLCYKPAVTKKSGPESLLGPINIVEAVSVREVKDVRDNNTDRCRVKASDPSYPNVVGPFPAESTARGTLAESIAKAVGNGARTAVNVLRRILR